jgi:hypothetical protein
MKSLEKILLIVLTAAIVSPLFGQGVVKPEMRYEDRIRIREALEINDKLSDELWDNWSKAAFSILLVNSKYEYLIRHPMPSDDFRLLGFDSLLKSDIYYRKKVFPENFLATFNAVNNIPTIVVGVPEKTGKRSSEWIISLLHEHLHIYQYLQPDYAEDVSKLGLAKGDTTGMWMLNFPFPYDSIHVNEMFNELCRNLLEAINTIGNDGFKTKAVRYLSLRKRFTEMLTKDDYNYFSFQLWQEGVAMYTELRMSQLAGERFTVSEQFRNLEDYIPFEDLTGNILENIKSNLKELRLTTYRRVAFYYLGAGEAILLDEFKPAWRWEYFKSKFYLEKYFNM